jgi:hypothetical protein
MSTDVMLIGSVVHKTGRGMTGGKTIYGTKQNISYKDSVRFSYLEQRKIGRHINNSPVA